MQERVLHQTVQLFCRRSPQCLGPAQVLGGCWRQAGGQPSPVGPPETPGHHGALRASPAHRAPPPAPRSRLTSTVGKTGGAGRELAGEPGRDEARRPPHPPQPRTRVLLHVIEAALPVQRQQHGAARLQRRLHEVHGLGAAPGDAQHRDGVDEAAVIGLRRQRAVVRARPRRPAPRPAPAPAVPARRPRGRGSCPPAPPGSRASVPRRPRAAARPPGTTPPWWRTATQRRRRREGPGRPGPRRAASPAATCRAQLSRWQWNTMAAAQAAGERRRPDGRGRNLRLAGGAGRAADPARSALPTGGTPPLKAARAALPSRGSPSSRHAVAHRGSTSRLLPRA